jgi:glycosyltransferase involved in cell wall biosynthesis
MGEKISAIIITFNEEKKIERCLRSLTWVDEIVVVDSFSTDRTVEICRAYTDKVYQHRWPNSYSDQRNTASGYTSHDWVLSLDADEVVTVGLRDEILDILEKGPRADLYHVPRREFFAGKWITAGGWYPQYKSNVYRKSLGEWISPIHEKFATSGKEGFLKNPILHDGYGDFKLFMTKFNHYSSLEAERHFKDNQSRRFSLLKAVFKPLERFYGRFIRHRGYKDGVHGFYMAAVIAINYFLLEMKVYEHLYAEKERQGWDAVYRKTAVGSDADRA